MTEIGFSFCGSTFGSGGIDNFFESFWMDSPNLLEPPFCELNPTSPGSTKSSSSLKSLLQGASNTSLGSTPPPSPWKNDLEDHQLSVSSEDKDTELGSTVNSLWQGHVTSECPSSSVRSLDHHQTKKSELIGADLLQDFDENGVTSTSDGLEVQLASADNAWTAALELPALAVEDVSQLLTRTQKPVARVPSLPYRRKRRRRRRSNFVSYSQLRRNLATFTDSESTETGSEGEEGSRLEDSPPSNLYRMSIAGRMETVEDLTSSSHDDDSDDDECIYQPAVKKTALPQPNLQSPSSSPRHPQLQEIDYTEPWWPQKSGLVNQRLKSRDLDGSGGGGGGSAGRSRRQMELWEFILCSLDTQKTNGEASAFQWVNRSVGVFRVTDTQKSAMEWGLYRGNARMDYEKMARAMRFYYKECVLRKAYKQLHFQFSMPFVVWSKQQHSSPSTFHPFPSTS